MKKILVIFAVFATLFSNYVKADNPVKIHPIIFCNTTDKKIGESCTNDFERFVEQLGIIQDALGCDVDWINAYTGKECNKPNLESAISGLRCDANDVIFFYYSGHGVHAQSDVATGWLPQMCLNYESYDQDKFVPVPYVVDKLSKKGARLILILTDCCNNEASWVSSKSAVLSDGKPAKLEEINISNLKKLFYESKGSVIATSSKRGQVSLGPKDGGLFSIAFWDEIYKIEQGAGSADWKSVIAGTKKRTLEYSNGRQEPVDSININGYDNHVEPHPNPNPIVISVNDKELGEAFEKITNRASYSVTQRLGFKESIISRMFDSDAKVIILGRNLKTKIGMPKSIDDYLEELAMSKTVKGINIVRTGKNNNGKYNYLEISEIR